MRSAAGTRRHLVLGATTIAAAAGLPAAAPGRTTPDTREETTTMSMAETEDGTQIFYKDWGPRSARPIVFHHGWPLSADDWDAQMLFFLERGYRVVALDRRGHGRSSQASDGNDMDNYAADAAALVQHLTCTTPSMSAIRPAAARRRGMWPGTGSPRPRGQARADRRRAPIMVRTPPIRAAHRGVRRLPAAARDQSRAVLPRYRE